MNLLRALPPLLIIAALLAPSCSHAYPRDDAGLVTVDVLSRSDVHALNELGMDILDVRDGIARISAVPSEVDLLWANGFRPRVVLERMIDAVPSLLLDERGEYHSYTELTADLAVWAAAYPSITELVSMGQSYEGRELWALKITDNPGVEEAEPEIQWIGCHHGNETISVEVPYYMIDHLLTNYGSDTQVTWLVDNREFWIIPMLNPDGHTAGSRYNGQGIDLNRNYACPCGCNAATAFSGVESALLRDFNAGMNPVTSLTFHSGAVYVNYLWDYTYDPTPDEPMIIAYSNGYSSHTGYPVTNGADWYIAHGTCQDWCYDTRGEIDWTIELSNSYDPPESSIDGIAAGNIQAMLYLARLSGHGIRGTVTEEGTGEPLFATISIPEIGKDVYTDPDVGDYHRMVGYGTYTVTAHVDGCPSQTVYNVSAGPDTFVVVNFVMQTPATGTVSGTVTDDALSPLAATVRLTDVAGFSTTSDPSTGYYELTDVPAGTHDVRASSAGYASSEQSGILVQDGLATNVDFTLASPLFFDDFESGLSGWSGGWSATTEECHTPSTCATDSPGGDYGAGAHTVMTLASPLDLSEESSAAMSFWHRFDTESGYDFCTVEASGDGGATWTVEATFDGPGTAWAECEIDLADYAGSSAFLVRFVLSADGWVSGDGWHVDDVAVFGDGESTGVSDEQRFSALRVSNYPNPFNPVTRIRCEMPAAGRVELAIYDVAGRRVRTLADGLVHGPGVSHFTWDGRDERSSPVAAGVYFAKAESRGSTASAKMVLLK